MEGLDNLVADHFSIILTQYTNYFIGFHDDFLDE